MISAVGVSCAWVLAQGDTIVPGYRFHELKGGWKGTHSVTVKRQLGNDIRLPKRGRPRGGFGGLPLMLNSRRRRPPHPGEILREDVLPEVELTQGEFAERLGVARKTVNGILRERSPVTVDMAHRLARALSTSPDVWLRLQQDVDIWDAFQKKKDEYARIKPLAA